MPKSAKCGVYRERWECILWPWNTASSRRLDPQMGGRKAQEYGCHYGVLRNKHYSMYLAGKEGILPFFIGIPKVIETRRLFGANIRVAAAIIGKASS